MDILEHNRAAWNRESAEGGQWSVPISDEEVESIRKGELNLTLTPNRPVPREWLEGLAAKDVLCLASSGGQQAVKVAAAGANVVSFDLSEEQLKKDQYMADRHGLALRCEQGDMADLSRFADASFDLIVHAVSNVFVPDVEVVWRECFRVLKNEGELLAGFMNPSFFLFDHDESEATGKLEVKYKLPYEEPASLDKAGLEKLKHSGEALMFGHSMETQLGGQITAGFVLKGLYEDDWTDELPFNAYSPSYIVTRASKNA